MTTKTESHFSFPTEVLVGDTHLENRRNLFFFDIFYTKTMKGLKVPTCRGLYKLLPLNFICMECNMKGTKETIIFFQGICHVFSLKGFQETWRENAWELS